MEARKERLLRFIDDRKRTFNIPVYQRNYDWKVANCEKLFRDLESVIERGFSHRHFLGIMVYVVDSFTSSYVGDFVRNYLTMKTGNISKIENVYEDFKNFRKRNQNLDEEGILKELVECAKHSARNVNLVQINQVRLWRGYTDDRKHKGKGKTSL